MTIPRILISNDDGIFAQGIRALAEACSDLGEVWIVAPDRERSATSHAISLHKPLRVRQVAEREFCVDGTPTDSVYMALHHFMPEPPDLVLSGINHGPNLGNDVMYSGTVSAAMEGAMFGYRAIAVSLCQADMQAAPTAERPMHFATAAAVTHKLAEQVLQRPMPPGVLLNVNVPNVPQDELRGIKLSRLGYSDWADAVSKRIDPRGRAYYWIGGERCALQEELSDSDAAAVAAGYVSLTPIHYDLTDYRSFTYVRSLSFDKLEIVPDQLGATPLEHSVQPLIRRQQRRV